MLWNWTVGHRMHTDYSHIVWTRSDSYWVDDLNMEHFPDTRTVYSRAFGAPCHVYDRNQISDQSLVLGAEVAGKILTMYSAFYLNPHRSLDTCRSSEDFMKAVADLRGVRWQIVRQDWLPFFLSLHMRLPDREKPVFCFRGLRRKMLESPRGECLHPSKLANVELCDELELQ
eukprot:TRINITY_DN64930_c0_g1_i1.p1 TRINITY_DN64930_c0_g1~~TRINITY_DN64930_c0_g1_i1.p1  ORF type:complete len:172 (+),score=21.10 TRINITY_DN64930_c0_g1_i1:136-651(+)